MPLPSSPANGHIPVMLREVIAALAPRDGGIYIDGTFGRGGYSRAILDAGKTQVVGIDRDPEAIAAAQPMIAAYAPRLMVLEGTFGQMATMLAQKKIGAVDGIALDLGVSSPQLDQPERGFSFSEDGPLDMRMSGQGASAADLIHETGEEALADILYTFGDERFSRRIARRIVEERKVKKLSRTGELASLVREVVPRSKDGIDPATRTFQALRIAVNDEMGELERGLAAAEHLLKPEGVLAVVSFHSLEDRCVKTFLRARSENAPRGSRHLPQEAALGKAAAASAATFSLAARKPVLPSDEEAAANPRSRSARLRVAIRTHAAPCSCQPESLQ